MRPFTIFKTPWEKRVFVGGSMGLSPVIEQIRGVVNKEGYDAIVASDFETPAGITIYHKCLLLLHCCKFAIFDFSEYAGQSQEFEWVTPYGITTLSIWPESRDRAITEMVKSQLDIKGIEHTTYTTFDEMSFVISEFLKKRGLPSGEKAGKRVFGVEKEIIETASNKERAKEEVFNTEKETLQIAVSVYYFDIHDGGHYFPVGDSPGLSPDMLMARGGGDVNFDLLVGIYVNEEPRSSHRVGGSYVWHINSAGIVDTTYKGVLP